MVSRMGLCTAFAFAAFGCGSAFSAQDDGAENEPRDAAIGADTSTGVGSHDDAEIAVAHDAPSPMEATVGPAVHPDATASLDAAKDQMVEAASPCAGTGGPPGVRVGTYCIDSTEVTNRQYAVFLAEAHVDNQPMVCAWNTSYAPTQDWPVAAGRDNQPVGWVDWCDAYAFCRWAGKRMCGKIGGGSNAFSDYDKPNLSQWYRACSKAGALRYPYGQDLDTKACNIAAAGINHAVNVKELPGCLGGYDGIYDMVGNVEEWEDSCTGSTGAMDTCRSRGLSYIYGPPEAGCALDDADVRSTSFPDLGIRCCSD